MVKQIVSLSVALLLSVALFVYVDRFLEVECGQMTVAVAELYDKTANETANAEDARAVKRVWEEKKRRLHIFVPHNDISYVDYWLTEAGGLIEEQNYELALAKLGVLQTIVQNIPSSYQLKWENIL